LRAVELQFFSTIKAESGPFTVLEPTFRAFQFKALRSEMKERKCVCRLVWLWNLLAEMDKPYQERDMPILGRSFHGPAPKEVS
jgi:hypothetical protein